MLPLQSNPMYDERLREKLERMKHKRGENSPPAQELRQHPAEGVTPQKRTSATEKDKKE